MGDVVFGRSVFIEYLENLEFLIPLFHNKNGDTYNRAKSYRSAMDAIYDYALLETRFVEGQGFLQGELERPVDLLVRRRHMNLVGNFHNGDKQNTSFYGDAPGSLIDSAEEFTQSHFSLYQVDMLNGGSRFCYDGVQLTEVGQEVMRNCENFLKLSIDYLENLKHETA